MKSILVLTAFLITSYASATPVVGDLVRYKMTVASPAYTQVMEQKIEVTALNPAAGTYTTKISVLFNGTEMSQSTEDSDMNSAEDAESTIDHCSEMPADMASLETITVAAGTFKVCHIKTDQNGIKLDQYMGKVMFGLVKSISVDTNSNLTTTFELIEVKKN